MEKIRRELVAVSGVHQPAGQYSHAARAGNLVFVAGQVALDVNGELVGKGDIEAQAVQVFENLKVVLASVGATMDDIVKTTTYATNAAYHSKIYEVRERYFKEGFPPGAFLVVDLALPEYLLEVEAVAVCANA